MKILVTGDREWNDIETIVSVFEKFPFGTIIVHGACRGADNTCAAVAEALGFEVRAYPADWKTYKKAAGPIRNQQMLVSENRHDEPIDLCIAFHDDLEKSTGTRDMVKRSLGAMIPVDLVSSRTCPRSSVELERCRAKAQVAGSIPAVDTMRSKENKLFPTGD